MFRNTPFGTRLIFYLLIALIAALFLPVSAMTHKPLFIDRSISGYETAFPIPNASISYAMYRTLASRQATDVFRLTIEQPMPFYARLHVPAKPDSADFHPTLVLFGPGLPTTHAVPNYSLAVPQDAQGEELGRAIYHWQGEADERFDTFTQTTRIQRQYVSRTLEPGTYYLAVYDPIGDTGRYILTTGDKEEFSFLDLLSFPLTWLKVRLWYDTPQTWLILLGIGSLLAGAVYMWRQRKTT